MSTNNIYIQINNNQQHIKLFDYFKTNNNICITGCNNKNKFNFNMLGNNKNFLYYPYNEPILYEVNCNIILSYLPRIMDDTYKKININSVNISNYNYNNKKLTNIALEDIYKNKTIIRLRPYEVKILESIYKSKEQFLDDITNHNINLYKRIEILRNNYYNKYKNIDNLNDIKPNNICILENTINENNKHKYNKFINFIKIILKQNVDIIKDKNDIKSYKYIIFIESEMIPYYHTEILINSFIYGTVPIYIGDPLINFSYNKNNMINLSTKNLTNNIIEVCYLLDKTFNDVNTYINYFKENLLVNENEDEELNNNLIIIRNIFEG